MNLLHVGLLKKFQTLSIRQFLDGAATVLQDVTILPFTKIKHGLQLFDDSLPGR
jgi:hypothetical protein